MQQLMLGNAKTLSKEAIGVVSGALIAALLIAILLGTKYLFTESSAVVSEVTIAEPNTSQGSDSNKASSAPNVSGRIALKTKQEKKQATVLDVLKQGNSSKHIKDHLRQIRDSTRY